MLDTYLEGESSRVASEAPAMIVRERRIHHCLGGAGNVVANLASLGARVWCSGYLGTDTNGQQVQQLFHELDVDTSGVIWSAESTTHCKTRIMVRDQCILRIDQGDTAAIEATQPPQSLETSCFEVFIVSDYRYGAVSEQTVDQINSLYRSSVPVVLDSKDLLRTPNLCATIALPSLSDVCSTLGITQLGSQSVRDDDLDSLARQLFRRTSIQRLAITLGSAGAFLVERESTGIRLVAPQVITQSDIGAGDALTAMVGLSLAAGIDVTRAVQLGLAAASLAVQERYTTVIQPKQLESILQAPANDSTQTLDDLQLATKIRQYRSAQNSIVFTNGVFDLLHSGHLDLLTQCKSFGDVLIVAVNSDLSVGRLKGPLRPVQDQVQRLQVVQSLKQVDHAILFDDPDPIHLIDLIKPDIHVKGGDYKAQELPEYETVVSNGGRVVIVQRTNTISTTQIIQRLLSKSLHSGSDYHSYRDS